MIDYDDFRTGLRYRDVYAMLWVNSNDRAQWRYKRRRTVLGHWRGIKQAMYAMYCGMV